MQFCSCEIENAFNTRTKKDNITLPWVDAELIFLGKYIKGANYMQNYMQNLFNCNECYFTFIKLNTNTHMKNNITLP